MICGPMEDGTAMVPEWLTPPQHRDQRLMMYEDPIGEPYKAPIATHTVSISRVTSSIIAKNPIGAIK